MKRITTLSIAIMCLMGAKATIYEAESATIGGDAVVKSDVASASGGSYVDTQSSGALTFNISVATAGWYTVKAATKSADARSEWFQINTQTKFKVAIPANATSNFGEIQIGGTHYFTAGSHTVKTSKDWGYLPIDYIKIESTTTETYQGEQVTLTGDNTIYNAEGTTSQDYYLDSKGANVTFNLKIPTAGNYKITILGKGDNTAGRTNDFVIDGIAGTTTAIEMVSASWTLYTISTSYNFTAGNHTLEMIKSWGYVGLDYLLVEYLGSGTAIDNQAASNIIITSSNKTISVTADETYSIEVYDISGVLVGANKNTVGTTKTAVSKPGIYVVAVSSATGKEVKKVAVQ